jgi:MFS family permease
MFVAIVATALIVLTFLSILQHNATLSRLVQQRLDVIAETTASSFRAIVDMGLPLSAMRNAEQVLRRSHDLEPAIASVEMFDANGTIVGSTLSKVSPTIAPHIHQAYARSSQASWRVETAQAIIAGHTIMANDETLAGAIVVTYPKRDFSKKTELMAVKIWAAAGVLLGLSAILAYLMLRFQLAGAIHGLGKLNEILQKLRGRRVAVEAKHSNLGFLSKDIDQLEKELSEADECYFRARRELAELGVKEQAFTDDPNEIDKTGQTVMARGTETSLAIKLARHLTPWSAALILGSALMLGYYVYTSVEKSFLPEFSARSKLIGTVANNSVQRAVSSGVPLEALVGAEQYFDELLQNFPEISYFGVSTGRIIIEAGARQQNIFAPERSRKDVPTYPITSAGKQIGYIIIDANPNYFAVQFRDVLLDFSVVVLVVILLAFQIMTVTISRALAAPFIRLQHLAHDQSVGDFSKSTAIFSSSVVDQLCLLLSERSARLHRALAEGKAGAGLDKLREKYKLHSDRPAILRFSYLNDVRLPLFLLAAADQLSLSFFPIYARSAQSSLTWIDPGVAISLPLAGYLFAIVLCSPLVRPLTDQFGHRRLIMLSIIPLAVAHIGLYLATNIEEIIIFRTLTGFGYAFATLACQDYVLDVVPREQRVRSLSLFTAALFGGLFAGTAMGGVLADRLGQDFVFLISAGLALLSGLLTARLLPKRSPREKDKAFRLSEYIPLVWKPLGNARFAALLIGVTIPAGILLQAFLSYLVALKMEALGASLADIGRTLMLYFLIVALVSPLIGRLVNRRLSPSIAVVGGAVIAGSALLVPAYWPAYWSVLLSVSAAGLAHGLIRDSQIAIALEIAEGEMKEVGVETVFGAFRVLERIGSIIGLVCVAAIASFAGFPVAIATIALCILSGALVFGLTIIIGRRRPSNNLPTKISIE